jgi:hypothetical protein
MNHINAIGIITKIAYSRKLFLRVISDIARSHKLYIYLQMQNMHAMTTVCILLCEESRQNCEL